MSSPVGLIYNPLSHRISKKGAVLESVSQALGHEHTIRLEDFNMLSQQLARFANANVQSILIEGGDGTAQAVITECMSGRTGFSRTPCFALIPGGMTNLAPKVIGLKRHGLKDIVRRIRQLERGEIGQFTCLPLLSVHTNNDEDPRLGFFLSTGAVPRAIKYCRAKLHTRGAAGSVAIALTLLRLLIDQNVKDEKGAPLLLPSPLSFAAPQAKKNSGDHLFTMATTLPALNLGLHPFWGTDDGGLRFTHAAWPVKGLARAGLSILMGKAGPHLERRGLTSVNCERIELMHDGEVVLDGEFLQDRPGNNYRVGLTPEMRFLR
jgi:diacylglycerol kinase (ATP)